MGSSSSPKPAAICIYIQAFPCIISPNAISELQLSFGKYQTDEQAWVDTIKSVGVGETVRISTMDWLGQSQYTTHTVYWSALSSAISEVPFAYSANGFDRYFAHANLTP